MKRKLRSNLNLMMHFIIDQYHEVCLFHKGKNVPGKKNRFLERYPFLYDTSLKKSNIKYNNQKDISKCPRAIVILMPSKIGKVFSSLILYNSYFV